MKIRKTKLTCKMMHDSQELDDIDRAERFKNPKMCPDCGGTNIRVWVPNPEFVAHILVDGQWEYHEEDNYDGDYLDWDNARYRCDKCQKDFVPTILNGWKAELFAFDQRL